MINKKDLIIKINKILNKFKKDKLIDFYEFFINKKGGSLRPLCFHLNNSKFDKEIQDMKEKINKAKIYFPEKYRYNQSAELIDFSKDIYLICKILKEKMYNDYDKLEKKNTELKFKFICYTMYLTKDIPFKNEPIIAIKEYIESNLLKLFINKREFNIRKIEKSNKLRITINNKYFDIIYTKDYNRINIVMYMDEVSEKKSKEYFDEFNECYTQIQPQPYENQQYPFRTLAPQPFTTQPQHVRTQPQSFGTQPQSFGTQQQQVRTQPYQLFGTLHPQPTQFFQQGPILTSEQKISEFIDKFKLTDNIIYDINSNILLQAYGEYTRFKSKNFNTATEEIKQKYIKYGKELFNIYIKILKHNLDVLKKIEKSKQDKLNEIKKYIISHIETYITDLTQEQININKEVFEEINKYKKFLEETGVLNIKNKDDIILLALIVQYHNGRLEKSPDCIIKYKNYKSFYKYIHDNYELYNLYTNIKSEYNELFKIRNIVIEDDKVINEYNKRCNNIITAYKGILKIIEELIGFNCLTSYLSEDTSNVSDIKQIIKDTVNTMLESKFKYKILEEILKDIKKRINKISDEPGIIRSIVHSVRRGVGRRSPEKKEPIDNQD